MSESEELNKELMAARIPTSTQLSQCPCQLFPHASRHNNPHPLKPIKIWELVLCGIACQVRRVRHQSWRASIAVGQRRLLDFIGMPAMLEGFPSWAQRDRTWIYKLHNDPHLNSVVALLSVLWDAHSSNSHTHAAHAESIWIVTDTQAGVRGPAPYGENVCMHTKTSAWA